MLKQIAFAVFLAAASLGAADARSFTEDLAACKDGPDPKARAEACAAAIEAGELQGDALAAAFAQYGMALFDSGEHQRGLAAATEAMRLNPDAGRYAFLRGVMHHQLADCPNAQADFDRALSLGEARPEAFIYRAECYRKEDALRALGDFDMAIRLAPESADAHFGRAAALAELGRKNDARASAETGLSLAPEKPESYVRRAFVHASFKDTTLAKADLAQALTLDADFIPALAALAELTYTDGQLDAALGYYDRILRISPDNPGILNNRCYLAAEMNRLDEALQNCDASIASEATEINLDSRGFVYLKRGDAEKALTDFDAALKLDPKAPASLYGRGVALARLGRLDEGKANTGAAAILDPEIAAFYDKNGLKP
ncbi:MAG: tetratricopeptide repeat protein [Micropepsaceae bacterium]